MTQFTGPGPTGWPRPYNDADFTTDALSPPAAGQWTGPGKFGYPGAYNDADFTTDPVTPGGYVLKEIALSAVIDGTCADFSRIDHLVAAEMELAMSADVPVPDAAILDVDIIRISLDRTYVIRHNWT